MTQLELEFRHNRRNRSLAEQECRRQHARRWFARMRRIVAAARDWTNPPPRRFEQLDLGLLAPERARTSMPRWSAPSASRW